MIEQTIQRRCYRYAAIGKAYRRWYRVSRAVIDRLVAYRCSQYPIPPTPDDGSHERCYQTLCDLVAITSPRCSVVRNLRLAWGEFNGSERPADMIRSTRAALDHYYATGEIRGAKTSRFAKVLRGDDSIVVIDTWMARGLGVEDRKARNKSTQHLGERVIGRVAKWYGWANAEAQAAIWAGIIRTHYDTGKVPTMKVQAVGLHRTGTDGTLSKVPF